MYKNPLISIITPSYNQGRFIEHTIQSVLLQDYPHIEYIIVDGNSTDNTKDIVNSYINKIDKFISEPDRGQTDAINKGFKMAKGDIVAWINSDDYYFPDAISRAVQLFQNDLDLDVLYGDCVFVDEGGQFLRYFTEVEDFNFHRLLNYANYIMQPTTFFRKSALEKVNYLNKNLQFTMDWDLWCRFGESGCKFRYERNLFAVNREYALAKTSAGKFNRWCEILKTNSTHKTTLIPRAAIGFGIYEILRNSSNNFRKIKFLNPVRNLKRFALRKRQHLYLYGLEPHGRLLDKEFTLKFPWYVSAPEDIEIAFDFRGNGKGKIEVVLNSKESQEALLSDSKVIHMVFPVKKNEFHHTINIQGQWVLEDSCNGSLLLQSLEIK
jgi:glycosyltransferase involved in cell wall biosynthesis